MSANPIDTRPKLKVQRMLISHCEQNENALFICYLKPVFTNWRDNLRRYIITIKRVFFSHFTTLRKTYSPVLSELFSHMGFIFESVLYGTISSDKTSFILLRV